MKTKNGIELNLAESNYIADFTDYKFYFSSELYLKKFKDELSNYMTVEEQKIKNKYKIQIHLGLFLAIALYKKIEKRGFLVVNNRNGRVYSENITFCNAIVKD